MMNALERRPFKAMKREIIDDFERRYLHRLLEQHRFDLAAVERSARLSRKHICALMQKHGLDKVRAIRAVRVEGLARQALAAAWGAPPQIGG